MDRHVPPRQQRSLLVRHFLKHFFSSELGPRQIETQVTLIQIFGLAASPGVVIMYQLFKKYARLAPMPAATAHLASLNERCLFLYYSMVVIGFVAVIEWNSLFPDRRDYLILTLLPIKEKTLFVSKAASLCIFLVLFSTFVNAIPAILYPLFASRGMLESIRFIFSHSVSVFAGNAFVFFACISVQGVLLIILSPSLFAKVPRAFQLFLLVALLSVFFIMPLVSFDELSKNSRLLAAFAPAWFLGLYETLLAGPTQEFLPLAWKALCALAIASLGFVLSYSLAYGTRIRRTLEEGSETNRRKPRILLPRLLELMFLRNSSEKATFWFVTKALARSQPHRTYFGGYLGTGLAFVVMGLVSAFSRYGAGAVRVRGWELLSIPLVMSFFILLGFRVVFSIPSDLRANWMFKLADGNRVPECLRGVRKAMFFLGIVPLLVTLLPLYIYWWGWQNASLHTIYWLILALILLNILVMRLDKIPFTCPNIPGKANLKIWWPAYFLGFTSYAYTATTLERRLLQNPLLFIPFIAISLVLLQLAVFHRNRRVGRLSGLRYEAEPIPGLVLLKLNRNSF
jgi:hypothetical protein